MRHFADECFNLLLRVWWTFPAWVGLSSGCLVCAYPKLSRLYIGATIDILWVPILHLMYMKLPSRPTLWCIYCFWYSGVTPTSKLNLLSIRMYPVHVRITTDQRYLIYIKFDSDLSYFPAWILINWNVPRRKFCRTK